MDIKKKILVIDDEEHIRRFIKISLVTEGFEYFESATAQMGLHLAGTESPDLVILDLGLPDKDGYQVLRELRSWSDVPVLILTARDAENETVKLLDGGANDYLSKPFGIKELIARIKVLLRDSHSQINDLILRFNKLSIDIARHQVIHNNLLLRLSKKEFALLCFLARHPQQLITQENLLNVLWGSSHTNDKHYLRIFVSQLRKKLNDNADSPIYIKTVPSVGYIFLQSPLPDIDAAVD
jgi:two-component system, OmpR family, KDP operon response regulator KdpE